MKLNKIREVLIITNLTLKIYNKKRIRRETLIIDKTKLYFHERGRLFWAVMAGRAGAFDLQFFAFGLVFGGGSRARSKQNCSSLWTCLLHNPCASPFTKITALCPGAVMGHLSWWCIAEYTPHLLRWTFPISRRTVMVSVLRYLEKHLSMQTAYRSS